MKSETLNGWKCESHESYPDTIIIECKCGHTSVRDRDEVADHVCPGCSETHCSCGAVGPSEEHACPYEGELKGNDDPFCRCCEGCVKRCARDV